MKLKRIYKNGNLDGVRVLRAVAKVQRFTPEFLNAAARQSWGKVSGGVLEVGTHGPAVRYQLTRSPGIYCCHCLEQLGDLGEGGTPAKAARLLDHVAKCGKRKPSPDANNPAGYRSEHYHTGVLVGDGANLLTPVEAIAFEAATMNALAARIGEKHRCKARLPKLIPGKKIVAADFVFNIAKGRPTQLYDNIDTNNPANCAFVILIIDAAGDTDATMKDRDDITALLGGTANEVTNTNYARKTLADADLSAWAPDDTNDRVDLDIPDQTWTAVAAGTAWTDFCVGYDNDTTAGTDANVTPLTLHDFAVTPDGSDITAQIASAGFFRAN